MFRVAIPARHDATRLPGKPLRLLAGLPLVLHVHRLALRSGASEVVIATDDERVRSACAAAGAAAEMTSPGHASGTDRLAELAARRRWPEDAIVVNVQGDEPLLPPALIGQVAALLDADRGADIATLATPVGSLEDYLDPNVVKVAAGAAGRALYFSRAPIPWRRDDASAGLASQRGHAGARRHIGLYAYRVATLRRLAGLPPSALERLERLEQLRALENGMAIAVADAVKPPGPGVDTPEDLVRVERLLAAGALP